MAPKITLECASDPAKRIFFPRRTRGSDMHVAAKDEGWGRGDIEGLDGFIGENFDDPVSDGEYTFRRAPAGEFAWADAFHSNLHSAAVGESLLNDLFLDRGGFCCGAEHHQQRPRCRATFYI